MGSRNTRDPSRSLLECRKRFPFETSSRQRWTSPLRATTRRLPWSAATGRTWRPSRPSRSSSSLLRLRCDSFREAHKFVLIPQEPPSPANQIYASVLTLIPFQTRKTDTLSLPDTIFTPIFHQNTTWVCFLTHCTPQRGQMETAHACGRLVPKKRANCSVSSKNPPMQGWPSACSKARSEGLHIPLLSSCPLSSGTRAIHFWRA